MNVEVRNLKKHFGRTRAVDDISFTFQSGQIVGFVGPNGAGKTTTIKIMATLHEPTSGDVLYDGISVIQEPERARRMIGYMPDALPTHRDMTVHEYLDFFGRAYGLKGQHRTQVIEQIEEFTNLLGIREKFLNTLSKGMKQRVSLARALVHDPKLLIMDEPAAGLDPRARVELRELLKLLSEQGKAILVSSHILTELAEICTSAVIIEQGRLLSAGTLAELSQQRKIHTTLIIRALEDHDKLYKELLQQPHIENVRLTRTHVEVELVGSDKRCSELLTSLVQQQFHIVEFHQQRSNLEDIFMNITKGEVQ